MGNHIKSFEQLIDAESSTMKDPPLLPFCHTTTEGYISSIMNEKKIESRECPTYKECLVYFFYGKASYLVDKELANYSDNPPITLIFDFHKDYPMKRVLPFDSGGFSRYKIKQGFDRKNFTHTKPDINTVTGLVSLLYKDNENYLKNQVDIEDLKRFEEICLEVQQIRNMYTKAKKGQLECGQQVYSIEVQYQGVIDFDPKYIILPYSFFTNKFWNQNLKREFPGIQIEYYGMEQMIEADGACLEAAEYQHLMREKVKELIKKSL